MAAQEKSLLELMNDFGRAVSEFDGKEFKPISLSPVKTQINALANQHVFEDETITAIAEFRVLNEDWFREGDRPDVQVVSIVLDGGGREQIPVPTHFFSGRALLAMESQIADELEAEQPDEYEP